MTFGGDPAPIEGCRILGIETSCDETAAAVVEWSDGAPRVRSNAVSTQHELHERYAGVVPELASRAHLERIVPTVQAALDEAGCTLDRLDAVAVGNRPGLIGSLLVGNAAAKAYAWGLGIPVIGIDHVAAHLAAGLMDAPPPEWPALGLVVSGGHTHLFRMDGPLDVMLLGRTIDDAIGEAFDKAATILGLGYPGGPKLDARSDRGDPAAMRFPQPRLTARSLRRGDASGECTDGTDPNARTLDFSFSGMKTALLYAVRGVPPVPGRPAPPPPAPLTERRVDDLCASFQAAAVAQLIDVLERAIERDRTHGAVPARTLLVGGGVSANRHLRAEIERFGTRHGLTVRLPQRAYCLDNAAMIAALAHWRMARGERDDLRLAPSARSTIGRSP
ncbi:MAG: t(6)A37 threonylcarbamoyladenosine biosynthesis protein [Planctomycetota bacterium]